MARCFREDAMSATDKDVVAAPGDAPGAGDVYHHPGDNEPPKDHHASEVLSEATVDNYWRQNIQLLLGLLAIWAIVSFGAGIVFVDALNTLSLGGYPLGFWFAQQGSIYVFVVLIFVYAWRMHQIEQRFGVDDD